MLEAAGEAFATHGFHGSSMDEIAAAAGITKPMLYRYFGSKEGLYAAYLRRTGRELIERVRALDSAGPLAGGPAAGGPARLSQLRR